MEGGQRREARVRFNVSQTMKNDRQDKEKDAEKENQWNRRDIIDKK